MDALIAVPSSQPGGLDAQLGAHFGHCSLKYCLPGEWECDH